MAVNGSIPGPTIFADWGDTVVVHVINNLTTSGNGTSIHFHGIRQNYTNANDGVTAITQCPTAPGNTITYTWKALQYGTTWYHSHFALQAWEGVFGGIVINGPATANYDDDLGVLFLNDWSHATADELFLQAEARGPPTLENGLINGTNVYGDDGSSSQTGSRFTTTFTAGTSYRLRLINSAIDSHFKFSIDNHTLTVVASDLVPIEPFSTTILNVGIGQRYDVIVTADQASVASSFWMRAIPQSACSDNENPNNIKGIVYYGSNDGTTPSTTGYSYTDSCDDETSNLTPYISKTVESANWKDLETATVGRYSTGIFRWYLNSTTMVVDWGSPTLLAIANDSSSTFETQDAVIELAEADQWIYFVVETALGVTHPIHLHGHDYFILAQGTGTYSSSVTLNIVNPPRRDTAMLPPGGYLVLAFQTDNPGVWLMHCHIGWHTAEGFAVQFIERRSDIEALGLGSGLQDNCDTWNAYQSSNSIVQEDSGI
jgi:FtsP/CotA-like multicopper oxidase with cupredoxin domain